MDNVELQIEQRVNWIKKVVVESGANGVMLGLSGGKDSAVVAGLCHRAGVKIYGAYLPIESNSEKDLKFIYPLVEKYNISFNEYSNDDLIPIWKMLAVLTTSATVPMAAENIKARLRMTMLYALAQSEGLLVVGTGNASEAYVGYFTKWGDGAHDFNPISDLTVSEVVALGEELGIPDEIIHRTPSAGLWEGQTDEQEMGVTYSDIECVIKSKEVSFNTFVKIKKMHDNTEHKRNAIKTYK